MPAMHINHEEFNRLIAGETPVLVDFWAPWCHYCRKINDAYDQIADQYRDHLVVAKVNIDDFPELAQREKLELIPTLRLYRSGEALGSIIAPESKAKIEAFIAETVPAQRRKTEEHIHDMVIIGGGPAGYTAALYAVRAGLDALVLEKLSSGGQMALTSQVDNYPGFSEGVDGYALAQSMQRQAERFGAKSAYAEVTALDLKADPKRIETSEGIYLARTVVLATGAGPRELGIEGEQELVGRGVAYCAACDGAFYKDKTVVVVGGGNSAAADALLLSRIAKKVILVHRRDALRATKIYHAPLMQAENVEFRFSNVVSEFLHEDRITGVRLKDVKSGAETEIACDGVFISVGRKPATELVRGMLDTDASGYIIAGEDTRTGIPGVFAAGDVRTKPLRQIVTAVADGATAVHAAEEYLAESIR